MIDAELAQRLSALEQKVDAVYASAEKTRKYIWWTVVITVLLFVVPLIGLAFVIPSFISSYSTELQSIQ
jgi:type IV secretory pathway component VirB8